MIITLLSIPEQVHADHSLQSSQAERQVDFSWQRFGIALTRAWYEDSWLLQAVIIHVRSIGNCMQSSFVERRVQSDLVTQQPLLPRTHLVVS